MTLSRYTRPLLLLQRRGFYEQGQMPLEGADKRQQREYFYYIDHQGMLFLDDAKMKNFTSCYKEKKFLSFFFRRIKKNNTDKYLDKGFNFISPCGPEINYIKCDDTPMVFTHLITNDESHEDIFLFNHGDHTLQSAFSPEDLYMAPSSGRIYHPTSSPKKFGPAALVSDKLSIAWMEEDRFVFKYGTTNGPSHFIWRDKAIKLTKALATDLRS